MRERAQATRRPELYALARKQGLAKIRQNARERLLEGYGQVIEVLFSERFPKLARLVEKQVSAVEDPERLEQVILRFRPNQDAIEAMNLLLDLDEQTY